MRFHHTCILTGSRELASSCEQFYLENFGMGIAFSDVTETSDYSFYADSVNPAICPLEIIGTSFDEREKNFLRQHGPGLDHICFMVEDLQAVFKTMSGNGVKFHVPPYQYENYLIAWCSDPTGVQVELLQADIKFPQIKYESITPGALYHHIAILSGSYELVQATENFYRAHIGLQKVTNSELCRITDGIFLKDSSTEPCTWIEFIGPAHYDNEYAFLEKNGPGMEHHCFVVEDVDHYYRFLINKGVTLSSDLIEISGAGMFCLHDPAGVCVWVLQAPGENHYQK